MRNLRFQIETSSWGGRHDAILLEAFEQWGEQWGESSFPLLQRSAVVFIPSDRVEHLLLDDQRLRVVDVFEMSVDSPCLFPFETPIKILPVVWIGYHAQRPLAEGQRQGGFDIEIDAIHRRLCA